MKTLQLIFLTLACNQMSMAQSQPSFELSYSPNLTGNFTGMVYLMFTESRRQAPSQGPDWFNTEPFYRTYVEDWKPDTPLVMDGKTMGFPATLGELESGAWRAQAVMRYDPNSASVAGGNAHVSKVVELENDNSTTWPISIVIDESTEPRPFPSIPNSKVLTFRSTLLSDFHKRDVDMKAVAFFPPGFEDEPGKEWPVLYIIGGFPGGLGQATMAPMLWGSYAGNNDFVLVYLGAETITGHHVFADSSNNGPYGTALVTEFIPWLESTYPLRAEPSGRLLTGHSSGGWSSLWLQVTYPDTFGGTWSTAPDPVDFRAFQEVDVYAEDGNAYEKPDGSPTGVARKGPRQPEINLKDFCRMEEALILGGQIRSFEFVFSPKGKTAWPKPLFDRQTGRIDPDVAEAWKKYDISLILLEKWKEIGPSLAGKIHVYMGNEDTFYLDNAVRLMKKRCEDNGIDVEIVMLPGDHSSILFGNLPRQILADMKATAKLED
tara:strand:+ start:2492 stop:3961 length:1470 start_codon:yes stop_codon:yes gene_type:complete